MLIPFLFILTLLQNLCKFKIRDWVIYNLILSSNIIKNWLRITPQFLMGIVHFLVLSLNAKNTDFITASSVGKESLFFVYFLIFPFRFSIRLVVYIIFLISVGKSKKTVSSSQLFSQLLMA